ncbi:MAG: NAD-dependent succinate-semialdehyde dehydrogenase [Candidatus Nanoarchaeia archaeon]
MEYLQAKNPSTCEIIGKYPTHSQKQIEDIIKKSVKAFQDWRERTVKERLKCVELLARLLKKEKITLAHLITKEIGKPLKQSLAEIEKCIWLCEHTKKYAENWLASEQVETDAQLSYIEFEPLGVIATITPWNFPFWQVFRSTIPTLVAGNTVILKHSSSCPACACELGTLFSKTFSSNVFSYVLGRAQLGEILIKDPRISGVSFTGSVEVGKKVYALASQNLKKIVLELGGSDPFIVLRDAKIEEAVAEGIRSRFKNAGQSCTAAKRFIVEESIAQEFVDFFVERVKQLKVGDPLEPSTDIGPLANLEQLKKIERQVKKSVEMGAKILLGGKALPANGYYYLPTVLINIKQNMPVWEEETFGPVAPIKIVKNEVEAIKVANDTKFGLGASIWSSNIKKARALAKKLEVGNVSINGVVSSDPRMPFGGVKHSGIGRELSRYGILEFTNIKSVKIYK